MAPSKVVVFWRAAVERIAKGKHPLFDNALDSTPNKFSAVDVLHRSHRGVRMAYWTVLFCSLCCVSVCGRTLV